MSVTRRQFLEDSLLASAAALAAAAAPQVVAQESARAAGPNGKLRVAVIGVRGRGGSHIAAFAGRSETEITYVCDADEAIGNNRADEIAKKQGFRPKFVKDMRQVFDDPNVDIVSTATPNHWHALCAIWAIQAGKHVYVEKPVSHNVSEGRRIVEAARKYNKIVQCGTQSRSNPGMREAIEFLRSGGIGEVKFARGLCYKPRGSIGPKGVYQPPQSVDYDLWCGPAPLDPLTRKNLHYDWHWVWSTGNGDLGNQGIHQMDIARWGLGVDNIGIGVRSYGGRFGYEDAGETANTQVCIHNFGDKRIVFEVRGLATDALQGAKIGVIFYGTDGYLVSPSYNGGTAFDRQGKPIKTFSGGSDSYHYANFLAAVQSGTPQSLNADILEGHLSSALCHVGNISLLQGKPMLAAEIRERLAGSDEQAETFDRFTAHLPFPDPPYAAQAMGPPPDE